MAHAVLLGSTVKTFSRTRPPASHVSGQRCRGWCGVARAARADRGFTLVELGAVVTIVGVLAMLAVVGYRRLITASHSSEATHMVNAIRQAQEAYKAETGTYANVSAGIAVTASGATSCANSTSMYPNPNVGASKTAWGAACSGSQCPTAGMTWDSIPVHVDGPVMYGYTTIAGFAGTGPANITTMYKGGSTAYTLSFPTPTTDWFVAAACGDPNGDGIYSAYLSSSYSNEIFESNDGE